ncbi:hypothetical protein LCL95_11795 [Bacillus timonensis]|nr:hypothetical protein [Bacillus timonensis]
MKFKILLLALALVILQACSTNEEIKESVEKPTEQQGEQVEEKKEDNKQEESPKQIKKSIKDDTFYEAIKTGNIHHIHGLGYAGNQNAIFVATHDGLHVYEEGVWYTTVDEKNDYMGFQAVDEGFYSSGHPGEGSEYENPLGVVKSVDHGKTLEKLAFYKESDFHYLAVGYENQTIYVVNQHPNSKLGQGLFYSEDDAKTWTQSKLSGLPNAGVSMIAAHPTSSNYVGFSTESGVYVSTDFGDTFKLVTENVFTTALTIMKDKLYYSIVKDDKVFIVLQDIDTNDKEMIEVPALNEKNSIMYVAVNPLDSNEIVITTQNADIYLTVNNGQSWTQLVDSGNIKK